MGRFVSYLTDRMMIYKGYIYHLVWVKDFILETPIHELVKVVCEFLEVFLEDHPGVSPERIIDIGIDIFPDT